MLYQKKIIKDYLKGLEKEIKDNYKGELIKTIYIGGGTPTSLDIDELNYLFKIIKKIKLDKNYEFTIECNVENTDQEKLELFLKNGVNRLSFGVETTNNKLLKLLNRKHNFTDVKKIIKLAKKLGFKNINVDLIYALPNEKVEDLEKDINNILKLDIEHISTYSLILEEHTKLYIDGIKNIDEELDLKMYNYIIDKLTSNGFEHYEISNFAKPGYSSKHNLAYWNNQEYYGFGLGASGYIKNIRYTNTRNIDKYINYQFKDLEEKLSLKEIMEYEMILGLRKIQGINVEDFYHKYHKELVDVFNIRELIKNNLLDYKGEYVFIPKDKLYISNEILVNFIGGSNGKE